MKVLDLESKDSNNTEELRQKNLDWFNMEMYPARDVTKCATVFMGTITHPASLLSTVLETRTDFIRNKFPAVIQFPERMDLWDEFCDIYKNYVPTDEELEAFETALVSMENPNEKAAMDFYRSHKSEMDKNIEVLWESRFPFHKLMMEKMSIGSRAFGTEFMNDPLDISTMLFNPDNFTYYETGMEFPHSQFKIAAAIDFAMGRERSDYSAVTIVAQDKRTKKYYVADSYLRKVHPDIFIKDIIEIVRKWQPDVIAGEAVAAQEFFIDTLKRELQISGYPAHSRVKKVFNRQRKELRIESMIPDIEEGNIIFNRNHRELLTQFERYGMGKSGSTNDDGPDSMQMAVAALKSGNARATKKPTWL